jgi:hypothetical protein
MDSFSSPREFSIVALRYDDADRGRVISELVDYLLDAERDFEGGTEAERLRRWAIDARPGDFLLIGIKGFGIAGLQYLRMLFGANTTKPDVHINRFVGRALGRNVTEAQSLFLLERAARRLSYSLRDVDYAIWRKSAARKPT